jgi:hypothetical protein
MNTSFSLGNLTLDERTEVLVALVVRRELLKARIGKLTNLFTEEDKAHLALVTRILEREGMS